MISSETIAEKIFKIIKGNGYNLEMYTDEGDSVVDTDEARRFYIPDVYTMINLDETDSRREIKVSVSTGTDMDKLKDTLYLIKKLANRSIIEYTLKTYTKKITPKDFDYQAQKARDMNTVSEAISAPWGSSKSSYQKLESAKLIIKHTKPVNEESRGSRSRNISAIYIENADGERYKFPSNNLAGGRAMLRHVKEGGNPYDAFGQHIVEQCTELKKLKEFKRYSEKNGLVNENTSDIVEAVNARITNIRESLNKLKGSKTYAAAFENFANLDEQLDEDDYTDIKDKFTVQFFDENVESALPYVNKLVKEMQAKQQTYESISNILNSLVQCVESKETFAIQKGIDIKNDPENPMRFKTESISPVQTIGSLVNYCSSVLHESEKELAGLLEATSKIVDNINNDAMLSKSARALASLMPKLQTVTSESSKGDVNEIYTESVYAAINKYDISKLFG
jgi:hypothetical protein